VDTEAVAEETGEVERLGEGEGFAGGDGLFDAGGDEGPDVVAEEIEGEEVPIAIHVGDVDGVDEAFLGGFAIGFAIEEAEFLAGGGGAGEAVDEFQLEHGLGAGAEGDGLFPVGEVEGDGSRAGCVRVCGGRRGGGFS